MLAYDIYAFARMIRDEVRTSAYAEALRRSIRPESVVLDLGTGVGIWALLACKFGARKVYALDPNDVIHVAREIAVANGVADKIEFIQQMSTEVTLPERPNLFITEMHGIVPMFEQNLPSIIDARERLLTPDSTMIPRRELLWAAPVEAAECFDHVAQPWIDQPYGFDWTPAMRVAKNDWFKNKSTLAPADFLAKPTCWSTLDYRTLTNPNVCGELMWAADRAGMGHGVLVWFDSELTDGIGFSNAPGLPETIFGQAFFPWLRPVAISAGDTISVTLRCDLVETYHLWRWKTVIQGAPSEPKAQFAQSSFIQMPLAQSVLSTHAPDFKPRLSRRGQIRQFILTEMDGKHSVANIAAATLGKFREEFSDEADALKAVEDVAAKYSTPLTGLEGAGLLGKKP
jgi:protein arginine N-methyltransferase 1